MPKIIIRGPPAINFGNQKVRNTKDCFDYHPTDLLRWWNKTKEVLKLAMEEMSIFFYFRHKEDCSLLPSLAKPSGYHDWRKHTLLLLARSNFLPLPLSIMCPKLLYYM